MQHYGRAEQNEDETWAATCSCGWVGNNPVHSEEEAREQVDYHLENVNEPEGLGG